MPVNSLLSTPNKFQYTETNCGNQLPMPSKRYNNIWSFFRSYQLWKPVTNSVNSSVVTLFTEWLPLNCLGVMCVHKEHFIAARYRTSSSFSWNDGGCNSRCTTQKNTTWKFLYNTGCMTIINCLRLLIKNSHLLIQLLFTILADIRCY